MTTSTLMRVTVVTSLVLFGASTTVAQVTTPRGFRRPTTADLVNEWSTWAPDGPMPYTAKADFNGDGHIDETWLFPSVNAQGWVLFVYLAGPRATHQAWQLAGGRQPARTFALAVAQPGRYRTECARGDGDCAHPEPEIVTLTLPGIEFTHAEGRRSIFWWNGRAKSFVRTWLSE
ncbi:MAG: hypothetical protein AB7N65_26875 [Vicinamibacterales bacterium]